MTNPASAMRMLITYVIVIPLAMLVGYLLTDPLDYGTLGFFGLVIALLLSPVFIRWHYPILLFGLGCPAYLFFLVGNPPLWEVVTILSLGISVVERAMSSRRFLSVPVVTRPLLYIAAMVYMTSRLTGGIGLHQLGGDAGGGKRYLLVFLAIASYFALTSRVIPKEKRVFYIILFVAAGMSGILGDMGGLLGGPFHVFSAFFGSQMGQAGVSVGTTRLSTLAGLFGGLTALMVVRWGLRGIFLSRHAWRAPVFLLLFPFLMLGGFRNTLMGALFSYAILFFLEGLHRTRLLPVALLAGCLFLPVVGVFSEQLPLTFQRSLSFLPLKWDATVVADAESSTGWRLGMWQALLPQVPQHLLLGKGWSISSDDFQMIGTGAFAGHIRNIDPAQDALAISGDYHSGPLSTLIPFGIWGAIGILWLFAVYLFVCYRNCRYGDPDLQTFNNYVLAGALWSVGCFFFIFGDFTIAVIQISKALGFSLALNRGLCRPAPRPVSNPRIKPLPVPAPLTAPQTV